MATASKRPGLPSATPLAVDVKRSVQPLNDVLNRITGVTLPKLKKLPANATNAQLIAAYNALAQRLQED